MFFIITTSSNRQISLVSLDDASALLRQGYALKKMAQWTYKQYAFASHMY